MTPFSDPDKDGDNDAVPSQDTDQDMGMGSGAMEMCVPTAALAEPDDTDQMTSPEVGDIVTMTVEGRITRVKGPNSYITPSAVNGQKMEKPSAPMDEESALRDQAAGMGNTQPSY